MSKKITVFLVVWLFLSASPLGRAVADQERGLTEISESSEAEEYTFNPILGTYTEITGGSASSATGDDGFQDINLPFVFTFDSLTYDTARISVNGWLQLGQTYAGSGSVNDLANVDVRPILAPFWDDLYDDATSDIRYQVIGANPERVFIVQWKGVRWPGSGGSRQNFQLRLYENDSKVEFIYGAMSASTNTSASIGVSGASASFGKFLSVTPGSPASASSAVANNNITSINNLPAGTTYQFQAPCFHIWTGTISEDWFINGNWKCNVVPGVAENATVPGGVVNMPIIQANASLARLDIDNGGKLVLLGGNISVEGIRIEGAVVVSGNETLSLSGTNLAWYSLPAGGTFDAGTGTVSIEGSGILTMKGGNTFHHVTIQSGKTFDPGESQLIIKGTFTNLGTFWPSHEASDLRFLGPVVNHGVWRGQLSRMEFDQGFENTSTANFYASQNADVGTEFRGSVTNHGTFQASDDGKLSVIGDWSNDGVYSPGTGTMVLKGNGKQVFRGGDSVDYYDIDIESGSGIELMSDLSVLHDLEIKSDSGIDLAGYSLKVGNRVVNAGKIAQTRQVMAGTAVDFVKISNKTGTAWVYWGVTLAPSSNMGTTRVTIYGSPQNGCTTNINDSMVRRCYVIEPQVPARAEIRFYFQGNELNGQVLGEMKLWHFGDKWSQVGGNYTYSGACLGDQLDCWLQADDVTEYSVFGLGSGEKPTIVHITRLVGNDRKVTITLFILLGVAIVMILVGIIVVSRKCSGKELVINHHKWL